jgi:hypothetical protein
MAALFTQFFLIFQSFFIGLDLVECLIYLVNVLFIVSDDVVSDEPADECQLCQGRLDVFTGKSKFNPLSPTKYIKSLFGEGTKLGFVR